MRSTTATPKTPVSIESLESIAREIRKDVVRMTFAAQSGHPGGSLSATDVITALYFGDVLRHDAADPDRADRDRFILSKGHGCPALYAALARAGYFSKDLLPTLRKLGSPLQGHPEKGKLPGIEASTGSLGQGLSIGIGMALAARIDRAPWRTYVMTGDGEIQEGQVWEAALFAGFHKLDNLCAIVDHNQIQLDDFVKNILDLDPLREKWTSFGWHAIPIDGHDLRAILAAFEEASRTKGKPTVILARTVKGKGVSFMENNVEFHGVPPNRDEMDRALAELDAGGARR
jgi:transketolase